MSGGLDEAAILDRIREYLVDEGRCSRDLAADWPLTENAVIDSGTLLDLVAFIEREFDISVEDQYLIPDTFQTLTTVTALVAAKRRQKDAGRSGI